MSPYYAEVRNYWYSNSFFHHIPFWPVAYSQISSLICIIYVNKMWAEICFKDESEINSTLTQDTPSIMIAVLPPVCVHVFLTW
jgi:hypothetical protein